MKLRTEKIRIIPFEQCHVGVVYRWYHSGDYEMFFGNCEMLSMQKISEVMPGKAYMIVNAKNADEVYGMFLLSNMSERDRNLQMHTMMDEKYQKSGYFVEALKLMVYYIMNCMNMFKLICIMPADNAEVIRIAEKFGLDFEGVLRKYRYHDGEFHDMKQYQIMKGPFNKRYKQEVEDLTHLKKSEKVLAVSVAS